MKLGLPKRFSWVSRYEKLRPWSRGSFEKSIPWRDVLGHESDLLGFRKEVVGHAIAHQPPHWDRWQGFLGNDLRRIENVELKRVPRIQ